MIYIYSLRNVGNWTILVPQEIEVDEAMKVVKHNNFYSCSIPWKTNPPDLSNNLLRLKIVNVKQIILTTCQRKELLYQELMLFLRIKLKRVSKYKV